MLPPQLSLPRFVLTWWYRLTEPAPALSQPLDRRNARLIATLFLLSLVMLVGVRIFRMAIHAPEFPFEIITYNINIVIMSLGYLLSRTRHYRTATFMGIIAVMALLFIQSVYRAYAEPVHLTDSTVWAVGMILIGGLIVSWQSMLSIALIFIIGLMLLPIVVPGLTLYDIRFSLEFVIGMTVLITTTAMLRQRDLERIQQQAAALTASEARYRTLMEAGFEALVIHDQGIILDVNDAVTELTGLSAAELIGQRTIDLVTPDSRPTVAKLYAGKTMDNLVYETAVQHKDGRRIDAEVRSRTITYQGQQVRVVAMRDITQLKQSSEQIKNLFDNLDRIFYSYDARTSQLIQISPACEKLYGYPKEELFKSPEIWDRIIHPDDQAQFAEDYAKITVEHNQMRPYRIVRKDGEIRWVDMQIIPVYNAANELTRYDGLATDITEQRQNEAEQRELQAERERSLVLRQFITDASHDLRTPLATLYTNLYLLRRVSPPDEKIARYLNTLEDQTRHLSRVLDDLFTMSRLDSPQNYVEKQRLDINQLMENVINGQRSKADKKQLEIHYFPTASPVPVMADKDYLLVALNHVVTNAVQYTPAEGSITIRVCTPSEKAAQIEIADTGIGIQPSEIDFIFDRFYRSDRARKTDQGGVGLGLSLARKIVEVHHGTIAAESAPGEGTIFRITLPLMLK